MTRDEFIEVLDGRGYSYEIEGDRVVVTSKGSVNLMDLPSLPLDVVFKNEGDVDLDSLTSIPSGVEFRNKGRVGFRRLTSIHPGVVFRNGGNVYLDALTSIPPGVEFRNGGDVRLDSKSVDFFKDWTGNIESIDNKRLLNLMIKRGMFI